MNSETMETVKILESLKDVPIKCLASSDLISLLNRNELSFTLDPRKDYSNLKLKNCISVKEHNVVFSDTRVVCAILGKLLFSEYSNGKNLEAIYESIREINKYEYYASAQKCLFISISENNPNWLEVFSSAKGNDNLFFDLFHQFADSIQFLSVSPEIILDLVKTFHPKLKDNGFYHSFQNNLYLKVKGNSEWAKECYTSFLNIEKPLAFDLLPIVFKGISDSTGNKTLYNQVVKNISSQDLEEVKLGIMCLGQLSYRSSKDKQWLNTTLKQLDDERYSTDELLTLKIIAITYHVDDSDDCKKVILINSENQSISIRAAIAFALFVNIEKHVKEEWFEKTVLKLTKFADVDEGVVYYLRFVVNKLVERNIDLYKRFFLETISSSNYSNKLAKVYRHELTHFYNHNREEFSLIVSEWFNNENSNFQFFIEKILSEFFILNYYEIELHEKYINEISEEDFVFILHKIAGFVHNHKIQTNLLLSALRRENIPQYILNFIHDIFLKHICYNYPSTNDLLKEIKQKYNQFTQEFIDVVVLNSSAYFERRNSLPILKEIEQSEYRAKLYFKIHKKQMQSSFDESKNDRSFFMNYAKNIRLRGGKLWFAKHEGKYSQKSPFGTMQHSFELPRGEFIDPLGQNLMRFRFRTYNKQK